MASKFSKVLKAAGVIGPIALKAVQTITKDPEILRTDKEQAAKLAKPTGGTPTDLLETIGVLRTQVSYLEDSADDAEETRRAVGWTRRLDNCERAAQILAAPGASKADRAALRKKVGELRSEIFEAFLVEKAEDMEKDEVAGS